MLEWKQRKVASGMEKRRGPGELISLYWQFCLILGVFPPGHSTGKPEVDTGENFTHNPHIKFRHDKLS